MKLIRLLAALAMVVAGLAAPVPAAAAELTPGGTPDAETMKYICSLLMGEYYEQDPLTYSCQIGDEVILCGVVREEPPADSGDKDAEEPPVVQRCGYEVNARMWPPPLADRCDMAGGVWTQDPRVVLGACDLKDIRYTVWCLNDLKPETEVCEVGSDQPMSRVLREAQMRPGV